MFLPGQTCRQVFIEKLSKKVISWQVYFTPGTVRQTIAKEEFKVKHKGKTNKIGGVMQHTQIRAKVIRDNTGIAMELPVIMTEYGPLHPLIDYLLLHSHSKSPAWQQKVVQAVGLLLDYMAANYSCFEDPKELFTSFVQRLYSGTIGDNGADPSGLYWLPRERNIVKQLSSQVAAFSDWLSEQKGAEPLNPWRRATTFEEMLNWAAFHQRHSRTFLGHTWDMNRASETAQKARNTQLKRNPKMERDGVKYFPEDKFEDLLFKGFIVPGYQKSPRIEERLNLRDILITLLQHYGGLRISEPFHLFVHDVLPDPRDPERALVRIFHPSEGIAPDDWLDEKGNPIKCTRGKYLRGKHLLIPRNEYPQCDLRHAGWKEPLLDGRQRFMYVHWFPSWAGKFFLKLWNIYLI